MMNKICIFLVSDICSVTLKRQGTEITRQLNYSDKGESWKKSKENLWKKSKKYATRQSVRAKGERENKIHYSNYSPDFEKQSKILGG